METFLGMNERCFVKNKKIIWQMPYIFTFLFKGRKKKKENYLF